MRDFAALYAELDASTSTRDKVAAMAAFFRAAPAQDAAWALWFLSGQRLRRTVGPAALRGLAVRASGYPAWLVEECYGHVGDLAETITLLTHRTARSPSAVCWPLHRWVAELIALPALEPAAREARILNWWSILDDAERYMLNKLLTGALRVGVSQRLVVQALAAASGLPSDRLAQRLAGQWQPTPEAWHKLLAPAASDDTRDDQPYPFFLASPLEDSPAALGSREDWLVEWKWDGIRAQLIRRAGVVALWSRGAERLDGRFPEIEHAATALPEGCVLDGEVLAWRGGAPLPFGVLQRRIGRLKPGPRALADAPVAFIAYDLLEASGVDLRPQPLAARRARLAALLAGAGDPFRLSPEVEGRDWAALAAARDTARARGTEGLMLKRLASPYQVGRRRGDWFKWKLDPLTIDAVLIYAQAGHGRRASLYTDYTFAVWHGDALVPVAKAYAGLDDAEIAHLDRWIRAHTRERFGPVRSVEPMQVFELAVESIQVSGRHKSGVAVRFPRILRWRKDKPAAEADRLETLQALAARSA